MRPLFSLFRTKWPPGVAVDGMRQRHNADNALRLSRR
jgi:hypothetical protein